MVKATSAPAATVVAPLVGAWIEIMHLLIGMYGIVVAPLVGAWIEITRFIIRYGLRIPSLPSWERGLKYEINIYAPINLRRSPRGSVD